MRLLIAAMVAACLATAYAQTPDAETLQLQIRAQSEKINALQYALDRCSGEVADSRYQKAQQSDSDALKQLMADVQAKHPTESVTIGPGGWIFTPKTAGGP